MSYSNIPIVVVLWQNSDYGGIRCPILKNTPNLGTYDFNDRTSAIGIHPGPNYDPKRTYRVAFYQHTYYRGSVLPLTQGAHNSMVKPYNFNDTISSVRIFSTINAPNVHPISAPRISPIPLVAELYQHNAYRGKKLNVIENIANTHTYANFGDVVTSVRVHPGPNYTTGKKLVLYRDVNYRGGSIALPVGNYPNIGSSHGFNDVVSSVKVR